MLQEMIDRYAVGAERLRQALEGLPESDYRQRIPPGAWSIQELVIHVVDSDAVGIDRMKRVIAEDRPPLLAFDESLFIARLHPHRQSLEDAITLLEAGRRQMVRILGSLAADDFQRVGMHSERGEVTLAELVVGFTEHLEHHLTILSGKRRSLGKPGQPPTR